ncbi:MAG: hypothetical protein GC129_01650 [Proteobacteria bacterium]|nr:hypothetical protein [Pseudomonadota bacterium]
MLSRQLAVLAVLAAAGTAASASATPTVGDAVTLQPGTVACISLRDAVNYASYSKEAPQFAADLLDRAACFMPKDPMPAVLQGTEKNFNKIKLLSGHSVWLPVSAPLPAR